MSYATYKISLQDATFPLLSEDQGNTVIGANTEEIYSKGKPGIYFCENVMPTKEGVQSVGYLAVIPGIATLSFGETVIRTEVIYSTLRRRVHLAFTSLGSVYALKASDSFWVKLNQVTPVGVLDKEDLSFAKANGVSYIYFANRGCYKYDGATNQLVAVTLTGLDPLTVSGIVGSSGYIVAYTEFSIAFSSTVDPTDFVPSTVTGAGGGDVAGLGGRVLFCTANSLGFIVHTETNAISAVYTGNKQYPFKFRPIDGAKGGTSIDSIAFDPDSAQQFVYSKAGLQALTVQGAELILPEVTDFLSGRKFEEFDGSFVVTTKLAAPMQKKLRFIGSRYLIISYGKESFTHALVYDVALNRLGKLRFPHVDVFELVTDLAAQVEDAKELIAFVSSSGAVSLVDFSGFIEHAAILFLGKLQHTRSRFLSLYEIGAENVGNVNFSCLVYSSLNGKDISSTAIGYLLESSESYRRYVFRAEGKNHTIGLVGNFDLNSILISYALGGTF